MAKESVTKAAMKSKVSTKKGTDIGRLIKAFLIGPLKVMGLTGAAYVSLWGISKLFMTVHGVVEAKVWPWIAGNWWILILAWLGIGLSVILYWSKDQNKRAKKDSKPTDPQGPTVPEGPTDPKNQPKNGITPPQYQESIFTKPTETATPETKKDIGFFMEHYDEEIEKVLGGSKTPSSPIFSAESVFGKITPNENGEKKEPFKFISEG